MYNIWIYGTLFGGEENLLTLDDQILLFYGLKVLAISLGFTYVDLIG